MDSSITGNHFADMLATWGDRPALASAEGESVTYTALADMADAFGNDLRRMSGRDRGLLLIEMENTPEAVIAYLGAVRARWPVILGAPGAGDADKDLVTRFGPDLIWRQAEGLSPGPAGLPGDLHPDLGVMLSTSGSTGSSKLVRLSRTNLHENARSIAEYLELGVTRATATTLPMHYSYGLSVLNSFLLAGGRVVLTDASVIDPGFRPLLDREQVTDLAGVPYTYELFERLGLRENPPASLHTMTQAGGRLPPDLVSKYAAFARDRGLRFFVMYGQTEATARMAYLPPDMTLSNADCIGVPIPRGSFSLQAEDGSAVTAPGIPGELVYRGPNVMMGYGLERADLAKPPELDALATGDIAELTPAQLYRIVGRISRFSKIAGLRIGFDDVERILRDAGFRAHVTGDDRRLLLAILAGDPEAARQIVAAACGLPAAPIFAWVQEELPVLSSGKTDYMMLRETGFALATKAQATETPAKGRSIAALYAHAMSRALPSGDESFSSLGGDSLAYVEASLGIEEILGTVPSGWETMSISALQAVADAHVLNPPANATTGGGRRLTLMTDVILRLMAISLIFIGHSIPDSTEGLRGGSGILFMLAGYSMAVIQLPRFIDGQVVPFIKATAMRLVLPYLLVVTLILAAGAAALSPSWYLLVSTFALTPVERGAMFSYWFLESLIHSMLLLCGLFLIPQFQAVMRKRPFATMMVLVALATLLRWAGATFWPNGNAINLTLDGWLWMFLIGWSACFVHETWQKVLMVVLALTLGLEQFGPMAGRAWWLAGALAVLVSIPSVRMPWRLGKVLAYAAGATYFMYLSHPIVIWIVRFRMGEHLNAGATVLLVYFGSILAGLVGAEIWRRTLSIVQRWADRPEKLPPGEGRTVRQ